MQSLEARDPLELTLKKFNLVFYSMKCLCLIHHCKRKGQETCYDDGPDIT